MSYARAGCIDPARRPATPARSRVIASARCRRCIYLLGARRSGPRLSGPDARAGAWCPLLSLARAAPVRFRSARPLTCRSRPPMISAGDYLAVTVVSVQRRRATGETVRRRAADGDARDADQLRRRATKRRRVAARAGVAHAPRRTCCAAADNFVDAALRAGPWDSMHSMVRMEAPQCAKRTPRPRPAPRRPARAVTRLVDVSGCTRSSDPSGDSDTARGGPAAAPRGLARARPRLRVGVAVQRAAAGA